MKAITVSFGNGSVSLSKNFGKKFAKLYASEKKGYKSAINDCAWLYGRPDTAVIAGEGAIGYLDSFKQEIQEKGVLVLFDWLDWLIIAEEEGPCNFWASCTCKDIARLLLEELGEEYWPHRHDGFFALSEEEAEEDCWGKYDLYDAMYN